MSECTYAERIDAAHEQHARLNPQSDAANSVRALTAEITKITARARALQVHISAAHQTMSAETLDAYRQSITTTHARAKSVIMRISSHLEAAVHLATVQTPETPPATASTAPETHRNTSRNASTASRSFTAAPRSQDQSAPASTAPAHRSINYQQRRSCTRGASSSTIDPPRPTRWQPSRAKDISRVSKADQLRKAAAID
jgi:hypothetical protein